ncbi:hypothetical protein B0H13DRAFT_767418 [Mycena leptocephala]|nr:hypothetical protein B0H13DRAFT_767418 [Mycena leptocephala]
MNVKVRCDVCFEAYSLDMFRFLPICGHGLCIVCSEQTLTKPNCVICRQPKRSLEPVQIFLTFAETSPSDKAHSVVENLNRIGPDSMPISVQKAGRKIRHVLRDIEPEDEVAVSPESNTATQLLSAEPAQQELLDAAKNLDERIYPLFLELDLANDTIATLNVEIQELRRQLKVAAFQEAEMKQLRRSLTEAKTEYKAAVALVAKTKEAVLKERSDNRD